MPASSALTGPVPSQAALAPVPRLQVRREGHAVAGAPAATVGHEGVREVRVESGRRGVGVSAASSCCSLCPGPSPVLRRALPLSGTPETRKTGVRVHPQGRQWALCQLEEAPAGGPGICPRHVPG